MRDEVSVSSCQKVWQLQRRFDELLSPQKASQNELQLNIYWNKGDPFIFRSQSSALRSGVDPSLLSDRLQKNSLRQSLNELHLVVSLTGNPFSLLNWDQPLISGSVCTERSTDPTGSACLRFDERLMTFVKLEGSWRCAEQHILEIYL